MIVTDIQTTQQSLTHSLTHTIAFLLHTIRLYLICVFVDEKLYNLCNNELTRNLGAVQNRRFITIPFSATTLGVRIGSLAFNLAEAVTALVRNEPLSALQFTEVSLEASNDEEAFGVEALGKSGSIVYTRLPVYGNVDLETFCPGGQSSIFIGALEVDTETTTADDSEKVEKVEPSADQVEVTSDADEAGDEKEESPKDTTDTSTEEESGATSRNTAMSAAMGIAGAFLWMLDN